MNLYVFILYYCSHGKISITSSLAFLFWISSLCFYRSSSLSSMISRHLAPLVNLPCTHLASVKSLALMKLLVSVKSLVMI